ncbi:MAG: hypothetical protein A2V66_16845 [Ignavibacteria bacterium RBG_13_36_8]|nr:MAG: hypothetical protein A2V66_16845 [Ignavibacteria bacterium RBG_13_36_8]
MNGEMSKEQVAEELEEIYQYLVGEYDKNDGNELANRITKLNIYLARSTALLSWAQFYYDKAQGEEAENLANEYAETKKKLSPTVFKQLINGRTINEMKLWKFCERVNRTITHQHEGVRSQLSYLKAQLTN